MECCGGGSLQDIYHITGEFTVQLTVQCIGSGSVIICGFTDPDSSGRNKEDPPCRDGNVLFDIVLPFKALSDQVWIRYLISMVLLVYFYFLFSLVGSLQK